MTDGLLQISADYWNIRGSFKLGGVLDIGTHSSLVRRANGKFVVLDAYTLDGKIKQQVDSLTNNGQDIEAILNLHPFHTVHVQGMHEQYPAARLYGTQRHLDKFPELPWQQERTETSELHELFSDEFDFSVPAGVDFISANENVHFSSVLVRHRASKTIHSDDTLMYVRMPKLMRLLGKKDAVSFHMTLGKALQRRAGAAAEFRQWAEQLVDQWSDTEHLCAAHTATLVGRDDGQPIADRIRTALQKVGKTLNAHEGKYG